MSYIGRLSKASSILTEGFSWKGMTLEELGTQTGGDVPGSSRFARLNGVHVLVSISIVMVSSVLYNTLPRLLLISFIPNAFPTRKETISPGVKS